ncbi:MAG: 30S ribosomal protein S6 [Candidatus Woykebacteria bacterium RBG_13_40_15]|uniref:Small ribosomal subunit protein bS6 n=1 Tax=Candidatus Woykebacteria bacterium RBG_13_40_15 TaxID=1802593 RepID=A0A1G1W6D6_9BACT|nr:MAG: 30S ribosomal protein S6 [Candidatus Woykebacteria bacterium RBG_13_40_15]
MTSEYELMVVLRVDLSESNRETTLDEIKKLIEGKKGKIVSAEPWGARDLAYKIKNQEKGFYTLVNFNAESQIPNFLNSKLKLMEELLRYLVVRKGD